MNPAQTRIAERRAELVARAASQRAALGRHVEVWRRPLTFVDKGLGVLRYVGNHPAWILGGALAPSALQPGRLGSWLRRGFLAFQVVSRLRSAHRTRQERS